MDESCFVCMFRVCNKLTNIHASNDMEMEEAQRISTALELLQSNKELTRRTLRPNGGSSSSSSNMASMFDDNMITLGLKWLLKLSGTRIVHDFGATWFWYVLVCVPGNQLQHGCLLDVELHAAIC